MIRGTTPRIRIKSNIKLSGYDKVELAIKQDDLMVIIQKDEMEQDGDSILIKLTQEQTLQFKAGVVNMQFKCKNGDTVTASNIVIVCVSAILNEEEM